MSTPNMDNIERHEEYYIRGGDVCFLVEKTLFRLHRYFFERESDFFRDKLNPSPEGENGSPDSPYIIHNVKSDDFADLVWIWYSPQYSFAKQTKRKWLTILHLATEWRFYEIQKLAVHHLEEVKFDPVEKIALYKKYGIDNNFLFPSYVSLCTNERLPSPEEGDILTIKMVLTLADAREKILLRASEVGCKTPTIASAPKDIVTAVVTELFGLTLHSNDQTFGMESQAMNNPEIVTVKEPTASKKGKTNGDVSHPASGPPNGVSGKGKQK